MSKTISHMRFSMRCSKCKELIKAGWLACPKCLAKLDHPANTTVDILRQNILGDVCKFEERDELRQGDEFFVEAVKVCLFDWEWAHELNWAEGNSLMGRCYSKLLI